MNILTKKELQDSVESSDNKDYIDLIQIFNEEREFLNSIEKIKYNDLSKKQKDRVDAIAEDMAFTSQIIVSSINENYYYSMRFRLLYKISKSYRSKRFRNFVDKYYDSIYSSINNIEEIKKALESYKDSTIEKFLLAYTLTYLTLITISNDFIVTDYCLLNKYKYKDKDINDFSYAKDTEQIYYISLYNKNKKDFTLM